MTQKERRKDEEREAEEADRRYVAEAMAYNASKRK